jgi:hypothetical protein
VQGDGQLGAGQVVGDDVIGAGHRRVDGQEGLDDEVVTVHALAVAEAPARRARRRRAPGGGVRVEPGIGVAEERGGVVHGQAPAHGQDRLRSLVAAVDEHGVQCCRLVEDPLEVVHDAPGLGQAGLHAGAVLAQHRRGRGRIARGQHPGDVGQGHIQVAQPADDLGVGELGHRVGAVAGARVHRGGHQQARLVVAP